MLPWHGFAKACVFQLPGPWDLPANKRRRCLILHPVCHISGLGQGLLRPTLAIITAGNLMSGAPDIGFFIWHAYRHSYVAGIIVALFHIGAVGLVFDRLMAFGRNGLVSGQGSSEPIGGFLGKQRANQDHRRVGRRAMARAPGHSEQRP